MEVLEGSPGPTVQNSRASSFCALEVTSEHMHADASADEVEPWSNDMEDFDESKSCCNTRNDSNPSATKSEAQQQHDDTQHSIASSSITHPTNSAINQSPSITHSEIAEIIYHLNEIDNLRKVHTDDAIYYRSWLCWLYQMQLSEISKRY